MRASYRFESHVRQRRVIPTLRQPVPTSYEFENATRVSGCDLSFQNALNVLATFGVFKISDHKQHKWQTHTRTKEKKTSRTHRTLRSAPSACVTSPALRSCLPWARPWLWRLARCRRSRHGPSGGDAPSPLPAEAITSSFGIPIRGLFGSRGSFCARTRYSIHKLSKFDIE